MKSLAASNRHIGTASARKDGVERNVRSSSAIEGISGKVFRSAASGRFVTQPKNGHAKPVISGRSKKR